MKRKILFAFIGALMLHILYFAAQLLIGLIQTLFYKPQFAPDKVVLQNEMAFGFINQGSPIFLLGSYIGGSASYIRCTQFKKERREQH
ncbi:hypothetical protein B857_03230 [Solibacillus isronensis B3W22]|uniref:Integral membrane protein n=1 Tax=Solibacillus isronensis B3W22 TaxID=1224748 RepID=K1KZR2_9BACL|nr:hypothetical protein [Solibacillus isronensis]AMO87649.1 hypothetical protein SOLI23_00005 [Solibacillus silvestris]EKB43998.1 hypothetical protein B857_03230 [Solibacillus isronensis B3W22]